jgi:hypothetical protein
VTARLLSPSKKALSPHTAAVTAKAAEAATIRADIIKAATTRAAEAAITRANLQHLQELPVQIPQALLSTAESTSTNKICSSLRQGAFIFAHHRLIDNSTKRWYIADVKNNSRRITDVYRLCA